MRTSRVTSTPSCIFRNARQYSKSDELYSRLMQESGNQNQFSHSSQWGKEDSVK